METERGETGELEETQAEPERDGGKHPGERGELRERPERAGPAPPALAFVTGPLITSRRRCSIGKKEGT